MRNSDTAVGVVVGVASLAVFSAWRLLCWLIGG